MQKTEHNVLVIRFSALGDVVLSIPVLLKLLQVNPYLRLTVLTKKNMETLFIPLPRTQVIAFDFKKQFKGITGLLRLFFFLKRNYSFSAVADLHNVMRTWVLRFLFFMSGIKVVAINKNRTLKRRFLVKKTKVLLPDVWKMYSEVFKKLKYSITIQGEEIKYISLLNKNIKVEEFINKLPLSTIMIAPFAKHKEKIYPLDKLEQIIKYLIAKKYQIIIMGKGEYEEGIINTWQKKYDHISTLYQFTLTEQIQIFAQCRTAIVMDSANLHLAGLAGTERIISIWGATKPQNGFNVWHNSIPIYVNLNCSPCSIFGNKKCYRGDYLCMQAITTNQIINSVEN